MPETHITLPEIGLIGATRAALGVGLGFLLADHLPAEQRRAVGWTLFLVGALSTIPLAALVFSRSFDRAWPDWSARGNSTTPRDDLSRASVPAQS
jgi:hypothetical protein